MDSATAAVAGPNNHTIEKDTIEDGHSKEMTCTCETTGQYMFNDQCHRMNYTGCELMTTGDRRLVLHAGERATRVLSALLLVGELMFI